MTMSFHWRKLTPLAYECESVHPIPPKRSRPNTKLCNGDGEEWQSKQRITTSFSCCHVHKIVNMGGLMLVMASLQASTDKLFMTLVP